MIIEIIELLKKKRQDRENPTTLNISHSAEKVLCREIELYNTNEGECKIAVGGRIFGLDIKYDVSLDNYNGWTLS